MLTRKQSKLLGTVLMLLTFTILVGCAAKKPFWGDENSGFILTYRLEKGQVLQYSTKSDITVGMEMMGQPMDIGTKVNQKYSLKSNGTDAQKNLNTSMTIDDMRYSVSSPQGENSPDLSSVIGKSFNLSFSPDGRNESFSGADDIKINVGRMAGGETNITSLLQDVMPDLPTKPVKIGDKWPSKDQKSTKNFGMDVKVSSEAENSCEGIETVNNLECLKIVSKIRAKTTGGGEQMGMQMSMEGDVETTATWYFAYKKGYIVKMIQDSFMEGTVAMSGQNNMTIPMTTETKTEMNLISATK